MKQIDRPVGLVILVIYKMAHGLIMLGLAIGLLATWIGHREIEEFALEGHRWIVQLLLQQFLRIPLKGLEFGTIAAMLYASMTMAEAAGLWLEKAWARWLVLLTVGLSLPVEVWELLHHMAGWKWLLFVANVAVFWYVLRRFPGQTHRLD